MGSPLIAGKNKTRVRIPPRQKFRVGSSTGSEQVTLNHQVVGSSPTQPTIFMPL